MTRRQRTLAAILLVAAGAAMAGCGKRGNLQAPPGSTYPRTYPAPDSMLPGAEEPAEPDGGGDSEGAQ